MENDTMNQVFYLSYDGMTDSLGESQVLSYLVHMTKNYKVKLFSFEKSERDHERSRIADLCLESNVEWHPLKYTKNPRVFSTLFDMAKCFFTIALKEKKKNTICHARSYIPGIIALYLKRFYKIPFVFDMRGWLIDENLEQGSWTSLVYKPVIKTLRYFEKTMIKKADAIISLTECAKNVLIDKYNVDSQRITVIPTCVDFEKFYFSIDDRKAIREKLGIDEDAFILIYSGSVGGYYNTEQMISFFNEILKKYKKAKFIFLTKTPSEEITPYIPDYLKNNIIITKTELRNVYKYLSAADAGLVLYDNTFSGTGRSPTKLAEYWATGLTVFCPANIGDLNKFFFDNIGGAQFEDFTSESYKAAIELIESQMIDRDRVVQKAIQFFDVSWGACEYQKVYERLTANH